MAIPAITADTRYIKMRFRSSLLEEQQQRKSVLWMTQEDRAEKTHKQTRLSKRDGTDQTMRI